MLWFSPFHEEEDIVTQMLNPCGPILCTCEPRWKPRWKMGWENYSTSGSEYWCVWSNHFFLNRNGNSCFQSNKTNIKNPLAAVQRQLSCIFYFIVMFFPYQDDPKCEYSCVTYRAYVQSPLDTNGINASIYNQMLNNANVILVHLLALGYGRKPDICTLKKYKGCVFS